MQTSKLSKFIKTAPWLLAIFPVFTLAFLFSSELVNNSNAETVSFTIDGTDYYIDITAQNVALTATSSPTGKFSSASTDVLVHTNSGTGYQLYLSMNNNDENGSRLYNIDDSTKYIEATTETTGQPTLNTWGFSTDNTDYQAVPLLGAETRIKTSSVQAFPREGAGDTTTVYYGLNVDTTVANGTYEGTVLYTAVADATAGNTPYIRYNNLTTGDQYANVGGGDKLQIITSLFTTMSDLGEITMSIGGTTCSNLTTDTSTGALVVTCNSTPSKSHGEQAIIINVPKFNKTYTTSINYATIWDIANMQDMTATVCKNTRTPSSSATTSRTSYSTSISYVPEKTLTDTRDNKTYVVRKLADGNCWMTQNLDLDLSTSKTLTKANTDLTSKNSWTPDRNTQTEVGTTWEQFGTNGARSYDFGNKYGNLSASLQTTGEQVKHAGNLYNYVAATAGSGDGSSASGYDAPDSICPKGWQLPIYSGSKSWEYLVNTVYGISNATSGTTDTTGINKLTNAPLSFNPVGYYYFTGVINGPYMYSYYITQRAIGSGNDRDVSSITIGKSTTGNYVINTHSGGYYRGSGNLIRCVAR